MACHAPFRLMVVRLGMLLIERRRIRGGVAKHCKRQQQEKQTFHRQSRKSGILVRASEGVKPRHTLLRIGLYRINIVSPERAERNVASAVEWLKPAHPTALRFGPLELRYVTNFLDRTLTRTRGRSLFHAGFA